MSSGKFGIGLGNAHIDFFYTFGLAIFQSYFNLVYAWVFYLNSLVLVWEFAFYPHTSRDINIKHNMFAVNPNAFYFCFYSTIKVVSINLFPFQKFLVFNFLFKL